MTPEDRERMEILFYGFNPEKEKQKKQDRKLSILGCILGFGLTAVMLVFHDVWFDNEFNILQYVIIVIPAICAIPGLMIALEE